MSTKYLSSNEETGEFIKSVSEMATGLFLLHNQNVSTIIEEHINSKSAGLSATALASLIVLLKSEYATFSDKLIDLGQSKLSYIGKSSYSLSISAIANAKIDAKFRDARIAEFSDTWSDLVETNVLTMLNSDISHLKRVSRNVSREAMFEDVTRSDATNNAMEDILSLPSHDSILKGGKAWDSLTNITMITTTLLGAVNRSMVIEAMSSNNVQMGLVTSSANPCPNCAQFEGRLLSITGKEVSYPSLDEAINAGLFHPNCQHSVIPTSINIANSAYDSKGRPLQGFNSESQAYIASDTEWKNYRKAHRGLKGKWIKNPKKRII